MDMRALEQIGLTESEIKVYLALLRLGQTTSGHIVEEAKVTRSKIYDILERLKNKGLVSYIIKESTKYFSAADPSNIIKYLDNKEKDIEEQKKSVMEILPLIEKQYKKAIEKNIAEIFLGVKGMQNAFNILVDEFNSKDIYYAFGAGKGEDIKQVQLFFERLHKQRVKKKVKSFIIFNDTSRKLFKTQEKSKLVEVKYLIESTPAAINIYKNYTIMAILTEDPITFLIRNKAVADSFREYFKIMWRIAKK